MCPTVYERIMNECLDLGGISSTYFCFTNPRLHPITTIGSPFHNLWLQRLLRLLVVVFLMNFKRYPPPKKNVIRPSKSKKKNTPIFLLKTSEGETICIGFLDTEVICHRTSHRTSSSNVVIRSSIWIGTNVKMWRICLGILKARGYRKISQMFKSNLLIGEIKDPVNFCEGIDRKQGCQQSCWQKKNIPPGKFNSSPLKKLPKPNRKGVFLSFSGASS